MIFNKEKRYARINSILLEDGIGMLEFKQKFAVDIESLSEDDKKYHEKYIAANYELIDWMISEEEQQKRKIKSTPTICTPKTIEAKITVNLDEEIDPTWSRLKQVSYLMEKGETSSSKIAEKLGTNPSYVHRLMKPITIKQ